MKSETTELLDKIEKEFKFTLGEITIWREFRKKLNDCEIDLSNGGYIQDKYGTLCRMGSVVIILKPDGSIVRGTLTWSRTSRRFLVKGPQVMHELEMQDELIEQGNWDQVHF